MKPLLLLLCGLLTAFPTDSRSKARCHSSCVSCRVRCKQRAPDPATCITNCLELKRSCCENCGAGPGPRTTCNCT